MSNVGWAAIALISFAIAYVLPHLLAGKPVRPHDPEPVFTDQELRDMAYRRAVRRNQAKIDESVAAFRRRIEEWENERRY